MNSNRHYYFSVGIDDIPWDRVVHWYGRATNFPAYFRDAVAGHLMAQKAAILNIGGNIEHQDGIIMATPFSLLFLFRLLGFRHEHRRLITEQILAVAKATRFQLEGFRNREKPQAPGDIRELLSEAQLWPPFVSEEQDEMNWEEYNFGPAYYSWLYYTADILLQCAVLLEQASVQEEDIATRVLEEISGIAACFG